MPSKKKLKIKDTYVEPAGGGLVAGANLGIDSLNLEVDGQINPYYKNLGAMLNYQVNPNLTLGVGANRGTGSNTQYNAGLTYTFEQGGTFYPTNSKLQTISADQVNKGLTNTGEFSTIGDLQGIETSQSKIQKQNAMNNMTPEMLAAYQQMMQKQQMMEGGPIQYNLGGDILAGGMGVLGGVGQTLLPGPLGQMAGKGVNALHGALDKNIDDQERAIAGYGKTAGAIGSAIFNPAALPQAMGTGAEGISQGLSHGSKWGKKNADAINTIGQFAGMAGSMATGNMNQTPVGQAAYDADYAKAMAAGASSYAQGGLMANGGLSEINAGGTHEQNPLGGVPQGPQALVEEGETIMQMDDTSKFAFSDRIKTGKGKETFADASKKIKRKYKTAKGEDRYGDAAAEKAMKQELSSLAQEQEAVKAEKIAKLQDQIQDLGGAPQQEMQQAPQMPLPGQEEQMMQQEMQPGMQPGMEQGMPTDPNMMMQAMGGIMYGGGGPMGDNRYAQGFNTSKIAELENQYNYKVHNTKQMQDWIMQNDPNALPTYKSDSITGDETYDWIKNNPNLYKKYQTYAATQAANSNIATGANVPYTGNLAYTNPVLSSPLDGTTTSTSTGKPYISPWDGDQAAALLRGESDYDPLAQTADQGNGEDISDRSRLNRNIGIGVGAFASSIDDFYKIGKGLQSIEPTEYDRYKADLIDLERERVALRNQGATASAISRENNRNATSSGQRLSMDAASNAAINANLAQGLGRSHQAEETANTDILNKQEMMNLQIGREEQVANAQAEAIRDQYMQSGLAGLGDNAAVGIKDVRQSDAQDRYLDIMEKQLQTPDFRYDPETYTNMYNKRNKKKGK